VICPAFAADCLETLEEIGEQNAELFRGAGGNSLRLIPCLNDSDWHVTAMRTLIGQYLPEISA
jgi:ferrochelatase